MHPPEGTCIYGGYYPQQLYWQEQPQLFSHHYFVPDRIGACNFDWLQYNTMGSTPPPNVYDFEAEHALSNTYSPEISVCYSQFLPD